MASTRKQRRMKAGSRLERDKPDVPAQSNFASVPQELLDEIVSHFEPSLPLHYNCDNQWPRPPDLQHASRETSLRALSQTCQALRRMTLPHLWKRIDTCWVPEDERGHWYKYVMQEVKRKASGVCRAPEELRSYVRTVSFMFTRSDTALALRAAHKLLVCLPALHTIHILNCKVTRELARALGKVTLPTVRVLILPDGAAPLVRACPNATYARCAGGRGDALIDALVHCRCERFEGAVQWAGCCKDGLMQRLVCNAPNLHTLEFRNSRLVFGAFPPAIRDVRGFKALRVLTVTFEHNRLSSADTEVVAIARDTMQNMDIPGERKLIVKKPVQGYINTHQGECDVEWSYSVETFHHGG